MPTMASSIRIPRVFYVLHLIKYTTFYVYINRRETHLRMCKTIILPKYNTERNNKNNKMGAGKRIGETEH